MELEIGPKNTDLGELPADWEVRPLGELGEALIGLTYTPAQVRDHGTLVLRSSNIQNSALVFDDNVFVDAPIPERLKVIPGDVLVCVRNGSRALIGKSVLLDDRALGMTFGAFMAVYRSPIGKFVSFVFQSRILKRQIDEHLGATINQITNKSLVSFRIPLPPSEDERNAITSVLSDVDALLDGLTRLIAKKRDLKQAAMQQLLTGRTRLPGFGREWAFVRLAQIGNVYGGLAGKSSADFGAGGARYIAFMDVIGSVSIRSGSTFERVRVGRGEAQNAVKRGDLLLNGSSETPEEVAMCSVCDVDEQDLFLNSFCFGFRLHPSADVDALFLAYLLRSDAGRTVMRSLAQGSTRYNIAKSAFLDACLLLPSRSEQAKIAAMLSDMDGELAALEARRAKTQSLKQAMMQSLLTGRIRLVTAEPAHA